jgi:dienelactone hydrolase
MRRFGGILIVGGAIAITGCGGTMPGLSPMSNSLTDGLNGPTSPHAAQSQRLVLRSPWDVAAIKKVAAKPKFGPERTETVARKSVAIRTVSFETEPVSGSSLSLSGTLVTPASTNGQHGHLPALVLLPDRAAASPDAQAREWAARGYAALALALPAKTESDKISSGAPEWTDEALASPSPNTNPLQASVAATISAVSLLAAQPEVDPKRVGLVGEGWGGVVAALASAVDDRPKAVVLARAAGGLDRGSLAEALKKLSTKDRETWTKAYDPDSYAKADHGATLFVQPLAAAEPPLPAVINTLRARAGTNSLALIPADAKDGESTTEVAWLGARLLNEAPLPEIRSLRPAGDGAVVQVAGKQVPRQVAVYYAAGDLAKAEWKSVAGEKSGDTDWRCSLPKPEDGKAWMAFAALTDARGAILCTTPGPLTASANRAAGQAVAVRPSR